MTMATATSRSLSTSRTIKISIAGAMILNTFQIAMATAMVKLIVMISIATTLIKFMPMMLTTIATATIVVVDTDHAEVSSPIAYLSLESDLLNLIWF